MSPRPFERPATIALPGSDGVLEGLHVPVSADAVGGAVIAPPHPLYGGSMDSPVVTEIAHACEHARFESLRFNWRGVGASAGDVTGDGAIAFADYVAALDWLEETVPGPIVACGYSFGAATAVRAVAGRTRVTRILLIAPPPTMLDTEALQAFPGEVFAAVGDRDEFAPWEKVQDCIGALRRSQFELLQGADHFFMQELDAIGKLARKFLERS